MATAPSKNLHARLSRYKPCGAKRFTGCVCCIRNVCQERDYATIIAVAEKIPNTVLEEDPKLLMWYDQARTRMGEK